MANSYLEIENRIKRGAEYLDKNFPGWFNKVDIDRLNLGNCSDCVIGQLTGSYYGWSHKFRDNPVSFGFIFAPSDFFNNLSYTDLTDAWREYILDRRKSDCSLADVIAAVDVKGASDDPAERA